MSTAINTNTFSIYAQRQASFSQKIEQTAMGHISSGERINQAKNDAIGHAIVQHQSAQINGFTQSVRNTNEGISVAQIADGALGSISDALQRMRELSLQSISGTLSNVNREYLQSEFSSLQEEMSGTIRDTHFNGVYMLNRPETQQEENVAVQLGGEFSSLVDKNEYVGYPFESVKKGYYVGSQLSESVTGDTNISLSSATDNLMFAVNVDGVQSSVMTLSEGAKTADEWAAEIESMMNEDPNLAGASPAKTVSVTYDEGNSRFVILSNDEEATDPKIKFTGTMPSLQLSTSSPADSGWQNIVSLEGFGKEERTITVDVDSRPLATVVLPASTMPVGELISEMKEMVPGLQLAYHADGDRLILSSETGEEGTISVKGHLTALGISVHDTSQVAVNHYDLDDPESVLGAMLLSSVTVSSDVTARTALEKIDAALAFVDDTRAHYGAVENQLLRAVENLERGVVSSSEARSTLKDADFAAESAELAKAQMMQQVATAMMAQANQVPQQMLQMLQ